MQKLYSSFNFNPTNFLKRFEIEKHMESEFNAILMRVGLDLIEFKQLKIDLTTLANDFETDSNATLKTETEQRTKTQIKYKGVEVGSIETILKTEGNNAVYSVEFTPTKI